MRSASLGNPTRTPRGVPVHRSFCNSVKPATDVPASMADVLRADVGAPENVEWRKHTYFGPFPGSPLSTDFCRTRHWRARGAKSISRMKKILYGKPVGHTGRNTSGAIRVLPTSTHESRVTPVVGWKRESTPRAPVPQRIVAARVRRVNRDRLFRNRSTRTPRPPKTPCHGIPYSLRTRGHLAHLP
jgi:hypothetical protein